MEALIGFFTSTTFIVNFILGVLTIEYALFKVKAPRNIIEERDSKYPAFRRTDAIYWTRPRLYLAAPILFPRFVLSLILPAIYAIVVQILLVGAKRGQKNPAWKTWIFKELAKYMSRIMAVVACGIFYYKHDRINKDYSKYLGPDWKPVF